MGESKTPWEQASEWFARTIAIVMMMVAPGALGAWLDGRLGTTVLATIGFMVGMALAITLLMLFVRIKPAHNDGDPRGQGGAMRPSSKTTSSETRPTATRVGLKPSESKLPELPNAEILDAPREDE